MNFKRIQEVFLFAFIVLDVFLVMMTKTNKIKNDNVAPENINSTVIKEMKRDKISLGKLSDKKQTGYYLAAIQDANLAEEVSSLREQDARIDDNTKIDSTFHNPLKVDEQHPEKTINRLLKKSGFVINGKQYKFNKQDSTKDKLVYDQKAIEGTFCTNNARLIFNLNDNHRLVGYSQEKLNDIKILHEKSELISQERAVIYLYQYNGIPNNSKVLWEKLAYTKLLHINGKDVYIPTWVIATQTNSAKKPQIHRINAFTGSEFKTEQSQNTTAN